MRRLFLLALPLLAVAACATNSDMPPGESRQAFVVFFEDRSAQLDNAAKASIHEAAELARRYAAVKLVVAGFADPEGAPEANRTLSRQRARAVADALIANGVARDRLSVTARGVTDFTMSPVESRRVEVRAVR